MDYRTKRVIDDLVGQIARLEERVATAERAQATPQLPNSSLTNAAIRMVDADGTDRGSIGYQPDGTVAVVPVNGPPPPKPSAPGVAAGQLSLAIAWDGLFAEGDDGDPATQPLDFDHVQVHLSTSAVYTPDADTLRGSLAKPGSIVIMPLLDSTTYYAVLVPVSTSGVAGDPSDVVSGVPDAVVSGEVLDGSITTLKLADNAVTNAKIADTAVDANKLADGSVSAQKILDDAITAAKIDDGAVTAAALGPDAVVAGKLADGSIDASTLFTAGVVDSTAIAANTIVAGNIAAGAIGTTQLAANAVVAGKIAANTITAAQIQAATITANEIASGTITASQIATDTLTANQIAAGAIGASELAANSVIAGKIAAGVVDATALAAQAVTTAKLDALAVTSDKIAANAIIAGKINAGAVTAATLEATMIVATVLESTGYVAGSSGWRIDGTGSVEFNSATFRGEVLVGPSGSPQVHVYSSGSVGRIEVPSGHVSESTPAKVVAGSAPAAGGTTVLQMTINGGGVTGGSQRPTIVFDSETANLNAGCRVRIGQINASNIIAEWVRIADDQITLNRNLNVTADLTYTSWTPVLSGGGAATFSVADGWYYLLGDLMFFNAYFVASHVGSGSTKIAVTLPFAPYRGSGDRRQTYTGSYTSTAGPPTGAALGPLAPVTFAGSATGIDRVVMSNGTDMTGAHIQSDAILTFEGICRLA